MSKLPLTKNEKIKLACLERGRLETMRDSQGLTLSNILQVIGVMMETVKNMKVSGDVKKNTVIDCILLIIIELAQDEKVRELTTSMLGNMVEQLYESGVGKINKKCCC